LIFLFIFLHLQHAFHDHISQWFGSSIFLLTHLEHYKNLQLHWFRQIFVHSWK